MASALRVAVVAAAAVLVAAAAATTVGAQSPDHCSQFPSCQSCVASPLCGWCSEPVVYPDNRTGTQCAGFNPNGTTPFACNGIYSTDQCIAGYVCDLENFQCKLGEPGQGNTLMVCEANCTNNGQVFLCNHTTKQCYQVPPGTPNSGSLQQCTASCAHPSPAPAPTPKPPTDLFACNYTTGQCDSAPAGKGEAKSVCQAQCKKSGKTTYMCNKFLQRCVPLPPSIPGGKTLSECENTCVVKPHPGPPPALNGGNFRGIAIQNGYTVGEFDMEVNETVWLFQSIINGVTTVIAGTPSHIPGSSDNEMWVLLTSGPNAGQTVKSISFFGQPGAETNFMVHAMGSPDGVTPASVTSAMATAGQTVYAFASCLSQACHFTDITPQQAFDAIRRPSLRAAKKAALSATFNDRCSQYDQNCAQCLSHQYCGWCSTNVTYKDGTVGTQCAGFNSAHDNSSAFVCTGRYSTLSCSSGYTCSNDFQCVPAAAGNGMPLNVCQETCHKTPAPKPQQQYVCNTTLKQCFKCNATHCPGSMPLGQCAAACTHPKHGPHSDLIGIWRGIHIENGYPTGEYEIVLDNASAKFYTNNVYKFQANITSLGADVMLFDVLDGKYKGWAFGVQYQGSQQYSGLYTEMTWAQGVMGQSFPQSFDEAMDSPGMIELVLAKCLGSQCKFVQP